jgi:tRNA (guanine37-N1)-methyltransferase
MKIDVITIFPDIFKEVFSTSIIGRAVKKGVVTIEIHDLRKWTKDIHKSVDDHPYGGGAGMLLMVEPIYNALNEIDPEHKSHRILTSPRGKLLKQSLSRDLAQKEHIVILCGHYEGVDQRVSDHLIDQDVSIGEYVLSGGELPAMVITDSIVRLVQDSLGNPESLSEESFDKDNYLEYDQYTRPETFTLKDGTELKVPPVLLGGNHKEIEKWKKDLK